MSDTSIPDIIFDDYGVCNFCKLHDTFESTHPLNSDGINKLKVLISKIKNSGINKTYDCVIGVSGGRDSTYLLYVQWI